MSLDKVKPVHVFIAVLIIIVLFQLNQKKNGPIPDLKNVRQEAHKSIVDLAGEHAAMRRAMAKALRQGKITTDKEYEDWFIEQLDPAYGRAFSRFAELEQFHIGREDGEEFDVEAAAVFNEESAEGFEEVK